MGNVDGAEETENKNQTRDTQGVVNERERTGKAKPDVALSSCCGGINSLAHPDAAPEPNSQRKPASSNVPSGLLPQIRVAAGCVGPSPLWGRCGGLGGVGSLCLSKYGEKLKYLAAP